MYFTLINSNLHLYLPLLIADIGFVSVIDTEAIVTGIKQFYMIFKNIFRPNISFPQGITSYFWQYISLFLLSVFKILYQEYYLLSH